MNLPVRSVKYIVDGALRKMNAAVQAYGTVTGSESAKDLAKGYHLARKSPELAPRVDGDWIDILVSEGFQECLGVIEVCLVARDVGADSMRR